ncbi:hypothetical protein KL921_002532 [Ogataea angusta]|uniref:Protein YIP n=1 Tax=Pichia angusta TaxID=870730 RepID=A0AAN6DIE4_PICAN|nr:uncharacterized protein KL928_001754 [Ogataea angusta]KAG7810904.1 hypothetical protein KL921_002532 [Ogataea angusta]KAG7820317.1 hypothetical protein KL928_001754 [Ogataea angusta]KAG7824001.1 hypothetical protein KL909_002738 [Ogataea angusta]KAG7829691.1 hypothetical protein KL920_002550 [Ogataea angusta]KAG7838554.1 hypothetical protein KL943_000630 [Ogataea angusta]
MSKYTSLKPQPPVPEPFDDDDVFIQPDSGASEVHEADLGSPANPEPTTAPSTANTTFTSSKSKKTYSGGIFTLNYYRQFFDLESGDFFRNCYKSLNPLVRLPEEEFREVGDLYGSVWITATLVYLLFFCNSFAELISEWFLQNDKLGINYFKMIITSINLLYGYIAIIPTLLYLALRFYFKVVLLIPLTKLISIYSYSNIMWIPAALLSIFRGLLINHHVLDSVLKWTCIGIGAILSGWSITVKISQYFGTIFGQEDKKFSMLALGLLILAHVGFSLGVKMCFFGDL